MLFFRWLNKVFSMYLDTFLWYIYYVNIRRIYYIITLNGIPTNGVAYLHRCHLLEVLACGRLSWNHPHTCKCPDYLLSLCSIPPLPLLLIIHSTAVFANHSVIHSAFVAIIFNIFMVVYHESNVLSLASRLRGWPFCCCCGLDWIALFTVWNYLTLMKLY